MENITQASHDKYPEGQLEEGQLMLRKIGANSLPIISNGIPLNCAFQCMHPIIIQKACITIFYKEGTLGFQLTLIFPLMDWTPSTYCMLHKNLNTFNPIKAQCYKRYSNEDWKFSCLNIIKGTSRGNKGYVSEHGANKVKAHTLIPCLSS